MQKAAILVPIFLRYDELSRQVWIAAKDNDLFSVTVAQAIAACKAADSVEDFKHQFGHLLDKLAIWLGQHRSKIDQAYLTVRDAGLLFIPVRKDVSYDAQLEDALTELDLEVAQAEEFDQIRLSVLALPQTNAEGVSSFINPELPALYYAHA